MFTGEMSKGPRSLVRGDDQCPSSCLRMLNFEIHFPEYKIQDSNTHFVQISMNECGK